LLATASKLHLSLHDTNLDTKTVVVVDSAEHGGTLMLEAEAEAGDFVFPAPKTCGSLEDTWRIEPDQLKCRKKSNDELWKLGQGGTLYMESSSSESILFDRVITMMLR